MSTLDNGFSARYGGAMFTHISHSVFQHPHESVSEARACEQRIREDLALLMTPETPYDDREDSWWESPVDPF